MSNGHAAAAITAIANVHPVAASLQGGDDDDDNIEESVGSLHGQDDDDNDEWVFGTYI